VPCYPPLRKRTGLRNCDHGCVKRHAALIPLSHDHQHALVQARRARRAADAADDERLRVAGETVRFFEAETIEHFREEEEHFFPLLVENGEPPPLVLQALGEHCVLHAAVERLRAGVERGEVPAEALRKLGERLDAHIRLEERQLFPLLEALPEERLARLTQSSGEADGEIAGPGLDGSGPLWGTATEDLNATLLAWPPGHETPEHQNDERDVLLVVLGGGGRLVLDGDERVLEAGSVVVVPKGLRRRVAAGDEGIRYVTAHLRRPPLQIASAPR
jgi:quercetin dioxygenase-like cupin family protein/iron-sulfur cluster repair protein YtfE (RIC family)